MLFAPKRSGGIDLIFPDKLRKDPGWQDFFLPQYLGGASLFKIYHSSCPVESHQQQTHKLFLEPT